VKTSALQLVVYCALLGSVACGGGSRSGPGTQTETSGTSSHPPTGGSAGTTSSGSESSSAGESSVPTTSFGDSGSGTSGSSTAADSPTVTLDTSSGSIVLVLDEVAAPITTANFLAYVESGFYDGTDRKGATIFHRVIPGFVIQGGGLTESLDAKVTMDPIAHEYENGLTNLRGTISMARTNHPDSATSQFFINLEDNDSLDDPPGYTVFGAVVEGMEVVDAIAAVETTSMPPYDDVPVEPILITSATVD
jgi:peptidyl-prolyl cis-trans isomerase A (cyclophilin A)